MNCSSRSFFFSLLKKLILWKHLIKRYINSNLKIIYGRYLNSNTILEIIFIIIKTSAQRSNKSRYKIGERNPHKNRKFHQEVTRESWTRTESSGCGNKVRKRKTESAALGKASCEEENLNIIIRNDLMKLRLIYFKLCLPAF